MVTFPHSEHLLDHDIAGCSMVQRHDHPLLHHSRLGRGGRRKTRNDGMPDLEGIPWRSKSARISK